MDSEPNACDNGNTTTAMVPDEVASVLVDDVEQNVLQEEAKRPLEESVNDTGKDQKKCKLDDEQSIISKRYLKKLEKRKKWLENKPIRAKINKEKKKKKQKVRALMRESGIDIQKVKTRKMADSTCKQRIVLDMSYDNLMSFKDLCKCSTQLLRCYGVNRRMESPMQFYVTSYEGKFKEVMTRHNGSEYWDILYMTDSFDKIFRKEEIVYLTSDSSNVLNDLDECKVYVIGGLVDHNSCKGASLKIAKDLSIAHARLPIDEFINMRTRKVLTIIHVFEILSKVVSGLPWKTAFSETIPKRKMFTLKDEDSVDDINCFLHGKQEKNESSNHEKQKENKCADIEDNKCPDVKENECSNVEENKYPSLEVQKRLDVE